MKKIAILTSGGDAPGMNAVISSITKYGLKSGNKVYGIEQGFEGLINDKIFNIDLKYVDNIINKAGTILKSARSDFFKEKEGKKQAIKMLKSHNIEGLIVIGGNGSSKGANAISSFGIPTIFIPSTIDNDVIGTEYCIGFDTAVNTVIKSIESTKEVASSIERIVIVEVMGRDSGDIALWSGVCSDVNYIIIPEANYNVQNIIDQILNQRKNGETYSIIIVSEGASTGEEIKNIMENRMKEKIRVLVLGYLQRGSAPTAYDRMIAS